MNHADRFDAAELAEIRRECLTPRDVYEQATIADFVILAVIEDRDRSIREVFARVAVASAGRTHTRLVPLFRSRSGTWSTRGYYSGASLIALRDAAIAVHEHVNAVCASAREGAS